MSTPSPWTRRRVLLTGLGLAGSYGLGLGTPEALTYLERAPLRRAVAAVLPAAPVETGVAFGQAIVRLVAAGVIDVAKLTAAHADRGPLPDWVVGALEGRPQAIVLSAETAPYLLTLLWPLGLATRAAFNDDSPLRGADLPRFASTGGWTLGREDTGAVYFNAVDTLELDATAEQAVRTAAEQTFRPCCDNSAFFQDCNHGSAMLGLFELAAAQGLGHDDLLALAKTANGVWYPQQYVEMALWFDLAQGLRWNAVPAAATVSVDHASASGWRRTIHADLVRRGFGPPPQDGGGGGCAV